MKVFSYKRIQLGQFTAHQFTLFELKSFASVILYWFCGQGWQGRYHSHAFKAVSFRLYGSYRERVRRENGDIVVCDRAASRIRYFSREHCHELGESTGCLTVLFAGPWQSTWREYRDGRWTTLGWGRRRL
jgi:hypothetical protein